MKAVVLRRTGSADELQLEEVADPEFGAEDVLMRVRASAVCGRDLIDRRGGFPLMKLPTVLGHEMAGEVVAMGEIAARDSGLAKGQRVLNLLRPWCGRCRACRAGEAPLCEGMWQSFGHTVDGGYAELVVCHHTALMPLPDGVGFEAASTLMCTAGASMRALRHGAGLTAGESVLITGASGGVGSYAVQVARAMGAQVIAHTSNPAKAERLRSLGAHHVVVGERFEGEVKRVVDGGCDVVFDLVGAPTLTQGLKSLRRGGRLVVFGNIETRKVDINPGALILFGLRLVGSAGCTRQDLEHVLWLASTGQIKPCVDRVLSLAQAGDAHRVLEAKGVEGRIVLVP